MTFGGCINKYSVSYGALAQRAVVETFSHAFSPAGIAISSGHAMRIKYRNKAVEIAMQTDE